MATLMTEAMVAGVREGRERCIVLAHGGGGELMAQLIHDHLLPAFRNEYLSPLTDGAVLGPIDGVPVMTTDGFVVQPLEFPGGDIGRLAVCGTVNDLAMMGARPVALTVSMILEEGLPLATLDRIAASMRESAAEAGVPMVTGDTKVIESGGRAPAMFITTAGLGVRAPNVDPGYHRIEPGDYVLINGPIAEHGLTIMSAREGLGLETDLASDAAPLNGLVGKVLDCGAGVKFMRDPTRGGLAGVLADIVDGTGLSVEIDEVSLPITRAARHAAELLGLDPLTVANEGKVLMVVAETIAQKALAACKGHPYGSAAAIIGRVTGAGPAVVELLTSSGGRRIVQRPYGEELPRIC